MKCNNWRYVLPQDDVCELQLQFIGQKKKKKKFVSHTFDKKAMCYAFFLKENELSLFDFFFFWYRKSSLQWTFVVEIYLQYFFFCWISALFLRLCSLTCGFHREIWTSGFGNRPDFSLPGLRKWNEKKKKGCFLELALRLTRRFVPTYLCARVFETNLFFVGLKGYFNINFT